VTRAVPADVTVSDRPVLSRYRGVICDLDGVVYRGSRSIPGAVPTLNSVVASGVQVVFATNNAARPPESVGGHLRELGLGQQGWSVVTSSQAAAAYLAARLEARTPVLAVGGPGVAQALSEAGLTPMQVAELTGTTPVRAVVQGAGQEVTWRDLAEVGYLAQGGAMWVATNLDATVPTSRGKAPGNGAFVGAVQTTTPVVPHVTGKPATALFDLARERLGTGQADTIVVGDRLDTDIVGARAAGLDSLLVLGGACSLRDLAFADEGSRPTYVAFDLTGLLRPAPVATPGPDDLVDVSPDGTVTVTQYVERDRLLQAVVAASWHAHQEGRALSAEASMWDILERQLGVPGP